MARAFNIGSNIICLMLVAILASACSSAPKKPKVYTVEIVDMKFLPETIVVSKGDTVKWINRDIMAHDVTEEATRAWSSSSIPAGGSWKTVVNANANYYCSIHVVMKGKLELE